MTKKMTTFSIKTEIITIQNNDYSFILLIDNDSKILLNFTITNVEITINPFETKKLLSQHLEKLNNNSSYSVHIELSDYFSFLRSDPYKELKKKFKNLELTFYGVTDPIDVSFLNYLSLEKIQQIWKSKLNLDQNKMSLIKELNKTSRKIIHTYSPIEHINALKKDIENNLLDYRDALILNQNLDRFSNYLSSKMNVQGSTLSSEFISKLKFGLLNIEKEISSLKLKKQRKEKKAKSNELFQRKLTEAISEEHFEIFLLEAGESAVRKRQEKRAQLCLIFILLYYLGVRINELQSITIDDIYQLLDEGEVSLILSKKNEKLIKFLGEKGRQHLKEYEFYITLLFQENNFKTLTSSVYDNQKPMAEKQLIRLVNSELRRICKKYNIKKNYKSHSFRAGYIAKLSLSGASPEEIAKMMGYAKIDSTEGYDQYVLDKRKILRYLNKAF
jgi:site-specific recombinase XerD